MEDYEIHWGRKTRSSVTPSRFTRATSAAPRGEATDEIGELDGYFLNAGLYRAKRALSEARDMLRESSMARESSVMESSETSKLKRSQLQRIQEASSEIQKNADGCYKITVTPTVDETWSTSLPNREWISPNTALTAKLLDVYNPSKYPDFIFGKYSDAGEKLHKPISATMSYMSEGVGVLDRSAAAAAADSAAIASNRYNNLEDSYNYQKTAGTTSSAARARSMARDDYNYNSAQQNDSTYGSNLRNSMYSSGADRASSVYADRAAAERASSIYADRAAAADRYHKNFYNGSYDHTTDSAYLGNKARRMMKYGHLLIPKHYPGTPMLGGYLLPESSQYTWRY